ncbi:MAG TPA: hypothetical protein VGA05_09190 [Candidatus Bathyarchaeia archaeon]
MNRVIASLTLLVGLAAMMIGVYGQQWVVLQQLIRQFVPFFG